MRGRKDPEEVGNLARRGPFGTCPMKILFLHGWHSVPGGVKPTFLAQHGHKVIYTPLDDDFGGRIEKPEAKNFILGKTHLIQSVEDVHELQVVSRTQPGPGTREPVRSR
jgi:hypothetical protein